METHSVKVLEGLKVIDALNSCFEVSGGKEGKYRWNINLEYRT